MEGTGQIVLLERTIGGDGKVRPTTKQRQVFHRSPAERNGLIEATTLIRGDCRAELRRISTGSIHAIITDPIYPEVSTED